MPYHLDLNAEPSPEQREAIMNVLVQANEEVGPPSEWQQFSMPVRDESGDIAGGAWGEIYYGWLFLELLSVPKDARRSGLGTRLIQAVEALAQQRGCIGIWLNTHSFQARPFYEKLGFRHAGTIDGFPPGHQCFIMQKKLGSGSPAARTQLTSLAAPEIAP